METPLVSVIVPVYKTPEQFLRACIESIQRQTVKDIQIILVDDGSPDKCGSICDEYATQDNRIQVLHQENGGPSKARNCGIKHVRGEYLVFIDADDVVFPEALEHGIAAMRRTDAQCAVFGWINNETGKPVENRVSDIERVITAAEAMKEIAGENDLCGGGYPWNKIWDVEAVRNTHNGDIPLFDCTLFTYEDKFWVLNMLHGLGHVTLLPDIFYDYRFVESSLTNSSESWKQRQFNAYDAYDRICDYLQPIDKSAYRAGLCKYFRFSFIDMKNMYSWRNDDIDWYRRTKKSVLKVCKRIRIGDLGKIRHYLAWIFCLIYCRI